MKTTNEQLDLISLANFLGKSHGGLHFKLLELDVIELSIADDQFILTEIALFFNLGETKTTVNHRGFKIHRNFFNTEEIIRTIEYNMPLTQLFKEFALIDFDERHALSDAFDDLFL